MPKYRGAKSNQMRLASGREDMANNKNVNLKLHLNGVAFDSTNVNCF